MVAGISHDIAFGMCHVEYKDISHDYVVCFWPCGMNFDHVECYFKITENFNLGNLKARNDKNHGIKRNNLCDTWDYTPFVGNPAALYTVPLVNTYSMTLHNHLVFWWRWRWRWWWWWWHQVYIHNGITTSCYDSASFVHRHHKRCVYTVTITQHYVTPALLITGWWVIIYNPKHG